MKSVIVLLKFKSSLNADWMFVTENAEFGDELPYKSANQFVNAIKDMHRKHSFTYKILNVVIG